MCLYSALSAKFDDNGTRTDTENQRGNALFLILIAVALFAALSYAVTQSGRGGGTISKEDSMVAAGEVTQYPAGLRTTVTRMIVTGTAANTIVFTVPGTGLATQVFDTAGGGAVSEAPPSSAGTGTAWGYQDVTSLTLGYWVGGVGTDAVSGGDDAIAYLTGITLPVCQAIQKGLGSATPLVPPVQATAITWATPAAQGGAVPIVAAAANALFGAGITSNAFACIQEAAASGNYDYYHVLIEQ